MAEEIKKKKNPFKIVRDVISYLMMAVIAVVAIVEIMALATKGSNYNVPNIFGNQFLVVATDSMAEDEDGSPLYEVGGAIVCKKVDVNSIEVGDDISFYWEELKSPMTHRVFEITKDDQNKLVFKCHGTNKNAEHYSAYQYQLVTEDLVLGKVSSYSKTLGGFINFMQSLPGLLVCILVPAVIIGASSIYDLVKAKKTPVEETPAIENSKEDLSSFTPEQIEQLKKELLIKASKKKEEEDK